MRTRIETENILINQPKSKERISSFSLSLFSLSITVNRVEISPPSRIATCFKERKKDSSVQRIILFSLAREESIGRNDPHRKFSRGQFFRVLVRQFCQLNGPRSEEGKLGRGMRYADIPTSRLFPPPPRSKLSLDSSVAAIEVFGGRGSELEELALGCCRKLHAHAELEEERRCVSRSMEDLSSSWSNLGRALPRVEFAFARLIVLRQREEEGEKVHRRD